MPAIVSYSLINNGPKCAEISVRHTKETETEGYFTVVMKIDKLSTRMFTIGYGVWCDLSAKDAYKRALRLQRICQHGYSPLYADLIADLSALSCWPRGFWSEIDYMHGRVRVL